MTDNLSLRKCLVQILVVALLGWMGPWQHFSKQTAWTSATESAIWGASQSWSIQISFLVNPGHSWHSPNLCHGRGSHQIWIAARWTCGWIAQQPDSLLTKGLRTLSEILVGRSFRSNTVGMHLRCCSCKTCQALTGAFLYNNGTKPPINWNITCFLSLASTVMLPKNVANDTNLYQFSGLIAAARDGCIWVQPKIASVVRFARTECTSLFFAKPRKGRGRSRKFMMKIDSSCF